MLIEPLWTWLVLGLLPYWIKRTDEPYCGTTLEIRALFWHLEVRHGPGYGQRWTLRVPLITRLRDAIWDALGRLRGE